MKAYQVKLAPAVFEQISLTRTYISDVLKAPKAAENKARKLLSGLENLRLGAEGGFDADKKLGLQIIPDIKTYGVVIEDYIGLYQIIDGVVIVSLLFSTKTDYIHLFEK